MTTRVPLLVGSYTARNVIAAAQRCLNLYSESDPKGETSPTTLYQTPGLSRLGVPPEVGTVRGLYRATNDTLYACIGTGIYLIKTDWTAILLGTIPAGVNPVKMQDNGTTMVIVDSSAFGWTVTLATQTFAAISDPNFFGSTFVEFIDTFLLFNKPGTNIFYSSPSNYTAGASGTDLVIGAGNTVTSGSYSFGPLDDGQTINITGGTGFLFGFFTVISTFGGAATLDSSPGVVGSAGGVWAEGSLFDPLYFAAKSGYPDIIAGIAAQNRNLWIIGEQLTSEIWFNSGAADFPFQIIPGPFIEYGTIAIYSLAKMGGSIFWLAQDLGGRSFVVEGVNFAATRISTWAIEQAIASYSVVVDAIGFCYTQAGHAFYWLKFPSEGVDWVYDVTTKLWHERGSLAPNCGQENHRAECAAYAYSINVVGDRLNGQLYYLDLSNPTDAGNYIERRRGYPHLMLDGKRVSYPKFTADMQAGTAETTTSIAGLPAGLASPLTFPATTTFINTTFNGASPGAPSGQTPNGTLLSDYYLPYALNAGDIGSQYTQEFFGTNAEIELDPVSGQRVITGVGSGSAAYLASGVPTSPDYIAQFEAVPTDPTGIATSGNGVELIGRAIAGDVGYQMTVGSNGSVWEITLTVMGPSGNDLVIGGANSVSAASYAFFAADVGKTLTIAGGTGFTPGAYTIGSVALGVATLGSSPGTLGSTGGIWSEPTVSTASVSLGLLTSGYFIAYLSMRGAAITVAVQRTEDTFWVSPGAAWQADFIAAVAITDHTYPLAGNVLIGGTW